MSQQAKVLDLHDLAAILLHEWSLLEPSFRTSRLVEVAEKGSPPTGEYLAQFGSTPAFLRYIFNHPRSKAFYTMDENIPNSPPVDRWSFKPDDWTDSKKSYSETDFETMFFQIKNHNNGYTLSHAMQMVIDNLSKGINLRIRTSQGHAFTLSNPSDFTIAEIDVVPNYIQYTCRLTKLPPSTKAEVSENISGEQGSIPWPCLVFGGSDVSSTNPDLDGRVSLDLASTFLCGMRGMG
jgi:hypothetical protein